jgi:hypothetical protein
MLRDGSSGGGAIRGVDELEELDELGGGADGDGARSGGRISAELLLPLVLGVGDGDVGVGSGDRIGGELLLLLLLLTPAPPPPSGADVRMLLRALHNRPPCFSFLIPAPTALICDAPVTKKSTCACSVRSSTGTRPLISSRRTSIAVALSELRQLRRLRDVG